MKNDPRIAAAIGLAAEHVGSNTELGRLAGIHGATVGQYRNGRISEISEDVWERLWPHIGKYLGNNPEYAPRSQRHLSVCDDPYPYNTTPVLQRLFHAWPDLCDTQRAKLEAYISGVLDASKNLDRTEAKAG